MADTVTIATTENKVTVQTVGQDLVTLTSPAADQVTVALGVGPVSLAGQTTDSLGEGSTNLYFSNARASAAAPVQSVVGSTGMNVLTNAQGAVSVTNTKLGTVTGVTMPSGYAVADVSGALTVSYNNLAAVRTGLGLVPGTSANQIVQLDGSAKLPAVDGSALTNLPSAPTFGIANTNAVKVDSTSVADDEYARFTANGLESRSTSEVLIDIGAAAASHNHDATNDITSGTLSVARGGTGLSSLSTLLNSNTTKSDVGLGNVENTAISTFSGSSNITQVGTISSGTWGGTAIAYADVSGTPTLGTASAAATGDFEASGSIATHNAITTAHGISAFGATLVDDANATAARATLGAAGTNHSHSIGQITGASTAAALDVGITSNDVLQVSTSGVTTNEFLRVEALGTKIVSRTAAEVLADIGASPEAGNTSLTTTGTIATGVWNGTAIAAANGGTGLTSISTLLNSNTTKSDVGLGNVTNIVAFAASDVSAFGATLVDDADAAAARTTLGVSNVGAYTGQIETASDKTYTLDPAVATARTVSGFYIKTGAGSVVANLKNGSDVIKQVTVGTGTGSQTGLANTSLAADAVLTLVLSSNSGATDVIFSVEYTE